MTHSPGPWKQGASFILSPDHGIICELYEPRRPEDSIVMPYNASDEAIANASLITVAPELLAVCQGLLEFIKTFDMGGDWCQDNYPAIKAARAAIAKAQPAPVPQGTREVEQPLFANIISLANCVPQVHGKYFTYLQTEDGLLEITVVIGECSKARAIIGETVVYEAQSDDDGNFTHRLFRPGQWVDAVLATATKQEV